MKKPLLFLGFASLLTLSLPALAQDATLKYHVVTETKVTTLKAQQVSMKGPLTDTVTTEAQKDMTLVLTPAQFSLRAGDTEQVFDFAGKKIYDIDHAKKTWRVTLIHSVPVWRKQRRAELAATASAYEMSTNTGHYVKSNNGMILDTKYHEVDLDVLYGNIGTTKSGDDMKLTHYADHKGFEGPRGTMTEFTFAPTKLPQALLKSYQDFLVHIPALHPAVEDALSKNSAIIEKLHFKTNNHNGVETDERWELQEKAINKGATVSPAPADYKRVYFPDDELLNEAFTIATKKGWKAEDYGKQIQQYIASGDGMRAMLKMNEMLNALPADDVRSQDNITMQVVELSNDEKVSKVMKAVQERQTTPSGIKLTNEYLMNAKKLYPDYVYYLDIFRARNIRAQMKLDIAAGKPKNEKEFNKAIKMYSNAIKENPWLALAYAEMGDAYYDYGDKGLAWICWEHALMLKSDLSWASNSSYKARIAKIQADIEKEYPEYF